MFATGVERRPIPPRGRIADGRALVDRLAGPLLLAFGFWLMFRPILEDGFRRSIGDDGDSIILLATLEHWCKVALGNPVGGSWRDEGFFYPVTGTLGLTDSYFLYALPYGALRALSVDPFAAFTIVIAAYSVAGYWSMYALCRTWPRAAPVPSAVAAFIFAYGAMVRFKLAHAQTYLIMLAPFLALLLLRSFRANRPAVKGGAGVAAGLLYGLILFSAAQTAWFLGLVGIAILACRAAMGWTGTIPWRSGFLPGAGFAGGLGLGFLPVAALYLPGGQPQHHRSFVDAEYFLPRATDLIHVQPGSLIWFDLLKLAGLAGSPERPLIEVALGYTPSFLLVAAIGAWGLKGDARWDRLAKACVAGALLVWALQLDYFGFVPWSIIFAFVPGGSLIRTPFRSQIACLFFMCLAYAHIATKLRDGPRPWKIAAGVLLALCVAEQIGPPPVMRRTEEMTSWLAAAVRPPFPCRAFFVAPMPGSSLPWFVHQADAMILSQHLHMPTLNGNSSWVPAGWRMRDPGAPDYPTAVTEWIDGQGLRGQVCGVDPRSGRWTKGISTLETPLEHG